MKLEPNVNGSPLVTPLKISSTVVGQQKLSKVEPAIPPIPTKSEDNEDDFEHFAAETEADEDLDGSCEKEANGSESCLETSASVKMEPTEPETGETETDETSVLGKKKSVRKKRSLNWEEAERSLLVEIIKPKVDFVENRSVDAKSIKSKRMSWLQVTKQFNSLNFRHRSLEQIQVQWRSMKNSAKKEYQQKNPKAIVPLEGLPLLEFMEEMQKEPIIGGTRSQTRNSTIQIKKELLTDDLDEEDDTPLAALPTVILNHSNSEDTQPTSTLAMPSPPTSAESHNLEFLQISELCNDLRAKKKRPGPKLKQRAIKTKLTPSDPTSPCDKLVAGIGLKIKRQRCETTNSTSLLNLSDASNSAMGITMSSAPTNLNANFMTSDTKPISSTTITHTASSAITSPPTSPPVSLDEKYKKQLFDLMKRARLADIEYARKEHEQKLRFEQQEQDLKIRFMQEQHEQRQRFALLEHEARMRVYSANTSNLAPNLLTLPPEDITNTKDEA